MYLCRVLVESGDGMAMMGSNVIDRRCVNLVDRRASVECSLMYSHEMICIDRRLLYISNASNKYFTYSSSHYFIL